MLGQCSSLATLNLGENDIGAEGAGSLAGVLGQCSALATLNLGSNVIGAAGARSLAGVLGQCSSLTTLNLGCNGIGDVGAGSLAGMLGQCSSLVVMFTLVLAGNDIRDEGAERLAGAGAVLVARAALSSIQSHQEGGRDNSEGEEDDGARRMMRMTVRMIKFEAG